MPGKTVAPVETTANRRMVGPDRARVGGRVWVVGEHHVREQPHEVLDRGALGDEDVAVHAHVVADDELALEVRPSSDTDRRTETRCPRGS